MDFSGNDDASSSMHDFLLPPSSSWTWESSEGSTTEFSADLPSCPRMEQDVSMSSIGLQGSGYGFDSDPYREQDNVTRGVCVAGMSDWSIPQLDKTGPYDPFAAPPPLGDIYSMPAFSFGPSTTTQTRFESTDVPRFESTDVPPCKPTHKLFSFQPTTLVVQEQMPHILGNAILNFLETQVTAFLKKVSKPKYAVKADVFVGTAMCSLKARVYYLPETCEYAMEIQKRSGDSFAFAEVFRQAESFLSQRTTNIHATQKSVPSLPALPTELENNQNDAVDLEPLLDMAEMEHSEQLQAEAGCMLANFALETARLAPSALWGQRAFSAYAKLVASDSPAVRYPTARLLALLASRTEASQAFAESGLLLQMTKSISTTSCLPAQREMAKAVSIAVRGCGAMLRREDEAALQAILFETRHEDFRVQSCLQDAVVELESLGNALVN